VHVGADAPKSRHIAQTSLEHPLIPAGPAFQMDAYTSRESVYNPKIVDRPNRHSGCAIQAATEARGSMEPGGEMLA
jgi:hypothetical protein